MWDTRKEQHPTSHLGCTDAKPGLHLFNRDVRGYSKTKANFLFICDGFKWTVYPLLILKLSFGTTKMAAYANNLLMFVGWYDIFDPYRLNNYWYNLFDLILSLVNENNGYSLIWVRIRRVYNNRSKDTK